MSYWNRDGQATGLDPPAPRKSLPNRTAALLAVRVWLTGLLQQRGSGDANSSGRTKLSAGVMPTFQDSATARVAGAWSAALPTLFSA